MTKIKNNLDTFKSLIGNEFNEVNLNKSNPHEYYDSWCGDVTHHKSAGVMNDFLKLFTINIDKDNSYGFAFIFDYIDLQEVYQKVQYSIKIKEKVKEKNSPREYFITSQKMEVSEFKDKLNQVNKELKKLSNPNYQEIINTLHNSFIPDFDNQVKLEKYTTNKNKMKR